MFSEKLFLKLPSIYTERLHLRRLEYSDKNDIFEYAKIPEVSEYLIWEAHESDLDTMDFLNIVMDKYNKNLPAPWGIELNNSSKIIGTIGFLSWDKNNCSAEVGYVLNKDYWRNGIMLEALISVVDFGFTKMMLNRIEARTVPENIASQKLLEKVGFKKEGLLREQMLVKGEFRDFYIYSKLNSEFIVERLK